MGEARGRRRGLSAALGAWALLGAGAVAWAAGPAPAIAQGQDRLIRAVAGEGEVLAGGCRLAGAEVVRDEAVARYDCEGGASAVLALVHPEHAGAGAALGGGVAVERRAGTSLDAETAGRLVTEVAGRALRLGAGLRWLEPAAAASPSPSGPPAPSAEVAAVVAPARQRSPYATLTWATAGAAWALVALGWWRSRRRGVPA